MKQAIATALVTCAVLLATTAPVQAGPTGFNFLYEFGTGELFSGMLKGELQADLETVIVTDVLMATFTGLPGVAFQTDFIASRNIVTFSGVGTELRAR